jgi:hypothetical protein
VDFEPNAGTPPSASTKFRHCSVFWTKANCIADNFNGFRKCVHLCGLTFELSGRRRNDDRPERWKMWNASGRAWRHAGGSPLERGVRLH